MFQVGRRDYPGTRRRHHQRGGGTTHRRRGRLNFDGTSRRRQQRNRRNTTSDAAAETVAAAAGSPSFASAADLPDEDTIVESEQRGNIPFVGGESEDGELESEAESTEEEDTRRNRFESLMTDDESSSDGSMPELQSRAEHTSSSDSDCGSDDTYSRYSSDVSLSELNSGAEVSSSFDSDSSSVFDDVGQDTARCAVCFMKDDQQDSWRRLMTLPCCGGNGKEESSSTRFCAACILRLAQTEPDPSNELPHGDDDRRHGPAKKFYGRLNIQTNARRCIECPRCRDIMIVNIKNPTSKRHRRRQLRLRTDWTVPTTADSVSLAQASFSERVRYAGRKRGYAFTLFSASLLHHSFLPRQIIGSESTCTKLVQWKILRSANKDVLAIDRTDQAELCTLLGTDQMNLSDDSDSDDVCFFALLALMGTTAFNLLKEWRVGQSARLMNRAALLLLHRKGLAPNLPMNRGQEGVVTLLTLFLTSIALQFLFISLMYCVLFFGSIWLICSDLNRSKKAKISVHSAAQMALGVYGAYRAIVALHVALTDEEISDPEAVAVMD